MSEYKPEVWATRGLLDQFCSIDQRMEDRAFAFILGAGASVPSGIEGGAKLVARWLQELKERLCQNDSKTLEEWATAENLDIEGFDFANAVNFYPQVFERRFRDHQEEGFAYLELEMEGREPSIGYSVLSKILAQTRHKVVITTNFDNLVADALAIYSDKHPLVAGHESLSGFVSTRPRRPLVAKIHRDLYLAPINDPGVNALKEGWERALKKLFEHYTPIVIGYGGNDGSLMELLRGLPEGSIPGGIFWCHRKGKPPTDERILEAVTKQHGKQVPIIGFDEFMMELGERLGYPPLEGELEQQGKARVERYREQFEAIQQRIEKENSGTDEDATDLRQALNATVERQPKNWWGWQLRINEETDADARVKLYREALQALPESHELIGNLALFLHEIVGEYDEAERLYRRALELDPNQATYAGNFALFLEHIRMDYAEAERLFRLAMELDPNHANITGNFAGFMKDIRKEYDEAERLYLRALHLDPKHANHTGNFASFMWKIRKDHDEAERLYRRALALDPNHVNHTGNLAVFMANIREDYDEAERLYRLALYLGPKHANLTGNFASFMWNIRKDHDEAERLYRRALDLEPDSANTNANYASILLSLGRENEAGGYASRACELETEVTQTLAETLLYLALSVQLGGEDKDNWLRRLKGVLSEGYQRGDWSFDALFEALDERLDEESMAFYRKIGQAILDEDAVAELEQDERWQALDPIAPGTPLDK